MKIEIKNSAVYVPDQLFLETNGAGGEAKGIVTEIQDCPILKAFLEDDDWQQIELVSISLLQWKRYQKIYRTYETEKPFRNLGQPGNLGRLE